VDNQNIKKGVIFGSIGVILIGLQPVIANARPSIIDPFIFAAITALIEAAIFLPLYVLERKKLNSNKGSDYQKAGKNQTLLHSWKKKNNIILLTIIGIIFSIIPVLLYIGYDLAGAILSSLTMKVEIVFALIFGFFLLKEKITKLQLVFCVILFLGLIIAITQGSFNVLGINFGVIILIICVALFTLIHTLTKFKFDKNELFPTQVVFIRNFLSGIILFLTYLIIFPSANFSIILDPSNFLFFLLMGLDYGFSLFVWYKTLSYINIGKATVIISLTPIVSSFFSFIILGEIFTMYHLIGTVIVIASIIIIVREKKENKEELLSMDS
jgi:drug/metabolite transporter (DMT)-like permease